jgi:hypothetical protein
MSASFADVEIHSVTHTKHYESTASMPRSNARSRRSRCCARSSAPSAGPAPRRRSRVR